MSTSKHTFDQVKSILGKLDRSIDDARAKRLDHDRPVTPGNGAASPMKAGVPASAPPPEVGAGHTALASHPTHTTQPPQPSQSAYPAPAAMPARPLRATPNYGGQSAIANGRAERKGF